MVQVMVQNIDRVLERGDKIELLVDKTEKLETSSVRFRRAAREVRSSACWAAWRTTVVAAVVAVLVLYGILALSCGGADIPQCR
jgi:vesicle-associated membrane protein 7